MRGYTQKLKETETSKVTFSGQRVFHRTKIGKGVPLVITHHPLLKSFGKIIYDKLHLLYINEGRTETPFYTRSYCLVGR